MKIKFALLAFFLITGLSAPTLAHGNHGKHATGWLGTAGSVFNGAEAFKHGAVVYDQLTGPAEERNLSVLTGNSALLAGHLFQIWVHTGHAKVAPKASTVVGVALAVGATSFDLFVDGVTTWEYWGKNLSVAKVMVNLVAPVCTALNLHSLYSLARGT